MVSAVIPIVISVVALVFSMFTWRDRKLNDKRDLFLRIHERLIDLDLQQGRRILAGVHSAEDANDLIEDHPDDYQLLSRTLSMLDVAALYVEQGYIDKSLFIQEWGTVYSALKQPTEILVAYRADRPYHTWSWPHLQTMAMEAQRTVTPRSQPGRAPGGPGRGQCRWIRTRSLSKIITRPSPAAIEVATSSFQL